MMKLTRIALVYTVTLTMAQGQIKLEGVDLVAHAVVLAWDDHSGRYEVKETLVRNPQQERQLQQLVEIEGLDKLFDGKDIVVVKYRAAGNPRTWVPITDGKVDVIDMEGRKRSILLAKLRSLWKGSS